MDTRCFRRSPAQTQRQSEAASILTGNGIFGNTLYVRQVDPNHSLGNDDHKNLLRMDAATGGRMVLSNSLAEILAERGKSLAVVSSGTSGSSLLVSPRAPKGVGVLVNAYWEPGVRVAFPDAVNEAILRRFPAAPRKGGAQDPYVEQVNWTERVLRDYVLPDLKPDVIELAHRTRSPSTCGRGRLARGPRRYPQR